MRQKLLFLPFIALVVAVAVTFAGERGAAFAAQETVLPTDSVSLQYPDADYVNVGNQQCLPDGRVVVYVTWNSYNVGLQWLDLSMANNGFVWGTFVGLGPMAPNANSQEWGGLLPGRWHYLRVNTLSFFGWTPSATVQFFTRSDCQGQQFFDSDGDGIQNQFDACPFQYGFPQFNGCPAPQGGTGNCGGGWCPGQPAPPQHCGNAVVQVIGPRGCVWVTKGEGASYFIGEQITFCYWVSEPMFVNVNTQRPDGSLVNAFPPGNDDGRGDCVTGVVGNPAGQRITRLYTANNLFLDQVIWYGN